MKLGPSGPAGGGPLGGLTERHAPCGKPGRDLNCLIASGSFTSSFPDTRRASTVAAGNPLLRPADVAFQDRAAARNASGSAARIRAEYRVHVRAGPWLSVIRLLVFANSREGEIASCGGFGSKHER